MKKSILISIKPESTAKILSGEKTIEIRRTAPKCDLPIDVYIYCTKGKPCVSKINECILEDRLIQLWCHCSKYKGRDDINGKIVAKFTLREVEKIIALTNEHPTEYYAGGMDLGSVLHKARLSKEELRNYLKDKDGYAWHMENLTVLDPMELSDFKHKKKYETCEGCPYKDGDCYAKCLTCSDMAQVTKAPKSWMYVEETK